MPTKRTPRVFVANRPLKYDVTPAAPFGQVVFVFDHLENDPVPSRAPKAALEHAHDILQHARPGDYLVLAGGDPLGHALVSILIDQYTDSDFNYLVWNRTSGDYTPVSLPLHKWEGANVEG